MYDYKAPQRDIDFVYREVLDYETHLQSFPQYQDLTWDVWTAIVAETAKFSEEVIAPLNQSGDAEGCELEGGEVRTPTGFKEAYKQFAEAGWQSLIGEEEFGGQGMPQSLSTCLIEMRGSANWSWASFIGFGLAGAKTLKAEGSKELQQTYLPPIYSGETLGTMCLTEPHCGTDLGLMRTKAAPQEDGSYRISGTKIFITAGDHDFTDNITHIVLARIEGAPEGVGGISVFVVPKVLENGESNGVSCGSLEHKMGIKGSATCVMNFEEATGYLIGEPNKGLRGMFHMMNWARIGTGVQGLCHAELGLQKSVGYARDRLQMRSLSGVKNQDGPADPIIVHPDVRRMLLTQKAIAEGGRLLVAYCAQLMDISDDCPDKEKAKRAHEELSYLTPILKAFMTESGFESASLAVQCFGGHGYIKEWGVEQNLRDCRISMLYEGTTGVQALDLLGRKVLASQGEAMKPFMGKVATFCEDNADHPLAQQVGLVSKKLGDLTAKIGAAAMKNPDEVGAASVDYMMYSGYVVMAYLWAKASVVAQQKLDAGEGDSAFYDAKLKTAGFYFERLLPRTESLAKTMLSGASNLMDMDAEQFLSQL
ncbi:phenylacyl-CoA dehydrogenase [Maricurvus nonylphenolicus]|uniref:acyl-CoA dehydrogenase C-terminal domain-containing protein n=1 Tax=Maricurvus nonylphenolicus TaxID=1008307 RepID=UPI0036F24B71